MLSLIGFIRTLHINVFQQVPKANQDRGYVGIMEKKMQAIIYGLGFWVQG